MASLVETARAVTQTGKVGPDDIRALRQAIFADGVVSCAEAEALFAIERSRTEHSDAWSELFVEALTDYSLNQGPPTGYLSEDTANWFAAEISKRKTPSTDADLELVTNLIEKAREVPPSFAAFALRLAKTEVIYGDGPDARGRMHEAGRVTEADVLTLQRILWGAGSEGQLAVSRDEAEALFAIADATTGAANSPQFDDLFAKAIGNYLLGATGRPVPSRETALRWETEPAHKANLVSVLGQLFASGHGFAPATIGETMRNNTTLAQEVEDEHAHRNMVREVDMEVAAIMTPEKAGWLLERVNKNGVMNGPERALLSFVQREASVLDPTLKDVIARVA